MHVVMLGVPQSVTEELERKLHEEGAHHAVECSIRHARQLEELPEALPSGLLVLWDAGGPLEDTLAFCQQLHARRTASQSHLVVLTQRGPDELDRLDQAGADECLAPPGARWGTRLMALERRLQSMVPSALVVDSQRSVRMEATLQALLELTLAEPGPGFFQSMVKQLAQVLGVTCALVGELDGNTVRKLACFNQGDFCDLPPYPLAGTPCQVTVDQAICHYPDGVAARFPEDTMLHEQGLRSYLGAALRDSRGQPIGVLAILNDRPLEARPLDYALINAFAVRASMELERLRARDELDRSREQLQKTLDAVPDPLLVKDRAHRWVAMNSAFCRLVGRPLEQLQGKTDLDFFSQHEAEAFRKQDEQVFTTGQPQENEDNFADGSGHTHAIVTKKALFTGLGGRPLLMVLCRDVTDRKRLESQLRLADRMASVGTLATGVAHEINNPLTFVSANITFLEEQLNQMMVMPESLPELREVLTETREGVGRIRELVQDLKSFARADEERSGPVDVHRVVDSALRLMRSALRHRTQVVRSLGEVPFVRGNEARLGQVLVNLLVNALQALPARHPDDNRIQVSAWREGPKHVVLEVADNGQGIPPDLQQRIFEPFFTTKPVGVGTGLGLAICQTIVQSMGGQIDVRSEPGQGTAFRLRLPVDGSVTTLHRGHSAALSS
ncbi:ATP-binding protein [Vitiosangium sp. GDMCC 1.1324]|uniref:ATP-binding protein n=1 Tax=Vitiosangium sp. (strain GDMCC 1.1324) TaxID=2138576 RepID=UPI000D3778E7|nr:ATP-binding protein [Vitiosangium sp. GDMCC 1.1324]PTL84452.1 hybrid sensor histidine kinase/response regulator [Vitiosangium sp. GDMCC 1.1324]